MADEQASGAKPRAKARNRLLSALPGEDLSRILGEAELVHLVARQILFDVDRAIEHVYFPETSVASIVRVMGDGTAIETTTVGAEGFVGMPIFNGTDRTQARAFCQIPGRAYRLSVEAFRAELAPQRALPTILHRYTQALFTDIAQSSACNRLHTINERCARWLLQCYDRVSNPKSAKELPLTHQLMSEMLGVRRASVTEAMSALRERGAIRYATGTVVIEDRARLEAAACECYGVVRREFERLLGERG